MIGRKNQRIQIFKRIHGWGGLAPLAPNKIIMGGA